MGRHEGAKWTRLPPLTKKVSIIDNILQKIFFFSKGVSLDILIKLKGRLHAQKSMTKQNKIKQKTQWYKLFVSCCFALSFFCYQMALLLVYCGFLACLFEVCVCVFYVCMCVFVCFYDFYILVCLGFCLFALLIYFLKREKQKECRDGEVGMWKVSRRSFGRKTIIRIYFIKIFFN